MSTSNNVQSEKVCYIPCNFCNTVLAVIVPCSNLSDIITIRCGHCTNLSSVNMGASFQSMSTKLDVQVPNCSSMQCKVDMAAGSSSKCKKKLSKRALPVNPPGEKVVNRPTEKRHRGPSIYNQFIKEEIQRIKVNNPDINHREAFSTAAKNWSRFPHVHFGLMLESSNEAKLDDGSEEHFGRLHS